MGRLFTVNRSTKYIFWSRNAIYDPSCIVFIVSYTFFYLMVYDKCNFEKKKLFPLFRATLIFTKFGSLWKILIVERFYCFCYIYPSIFYSTRILLIHASGLISNLLNIHGIYSKEYCININRPGQNAQRCRLGALGQAKPLIRARFFGSAYFEL